MALVSKNIPNLINGVSQQPSALRLASQGEVQENGFSDIVDGLKKRPPTEFKNTLRKGSPTGTALSSTELGRSYFHTYKRSDSEQFTVVYDPVDTKMRVYDIDGKLRYESGTASWDANGTQITSNSDSTAYLSGITSADIASTSVADYTFFVNKKKKVLASTEIYPPARPSEALVYLKQADYERSYEVTITPKADSSTEYTPFSSTHATGDSQNEANLQTSTIISALRDSIFTTADRQTFSRRSSAGTNWTASSMRNYTLISGLASATLSNIRVRSGSRLLSSSEWTLSGTTLTITTSGHVESSRQRHGFTHYNANPVEVFLVTAPAAPSDSFVTLPATYRSEPMFVVSSLDYDFDIQASDDSGGTSLRVFKETAKNFTSLPNQCVDGFHLAVIGDNQKKEDNFYVEFDGDTGQGVWKETVAAGIQNKFDLTTMPHILTQNDDLSFSFKQAEWDDRKAGDDDTNPFPSFVDSTISDVFFHRNRLGMLSGENVIFSEASTYFNFFRTTVRSLLDSAPIDVAVSQNEVSDLEAAVPTQDNLMLFSNLTQFNLSTAQLLTPSEVTIDQSTRYECDLTSKPVGVGTSVYFTHKDGNFSGLRELYTQGDTDNQDAPSVTSHVPEYISGGVRQMIASSNEDMLICLTDDNKNECYVYKWYDSDRERLQSSWSKWVFTTRELNDEDEWVDAPIDIEHIAFNNTDVFFVFADGSFERMSLTNSGVDVLVDHRFKIESTGSLADYPRATTDTTQYVTKEGNLLTASNVPTYLATEGNYIYVGEPYTFKYQFSEQVFKPADDPTRLARYQLRRISLNYNDTGSFEVTVQSTGRDPKVTDFTGRILSQANNLLGSAPTVEDGTLTVGLQSQAKETDITITNSSHLPSTFQNAEVEAYVTQRTKRI